MHTREPEATALTARRAAEDAGYLLSRFEELLSRDPHAPAVFDDRGNALDRRRLWDLAGDIAGEMRERGLPRGAVVIICMPNWTEWMAAYLATLRCRLIPATPPVTTDPKALAHLCNLVGAHAVILPTRHRGRDFTAEAATIAETTGRHLHTVLLDGNQSGRWWHTFDGPAPVPPRYPDGLAHILFSSSTTGASKAIAHSDTTSNAYNDAIIDRYDITDAQPIFMPSPLGHSTGFWHGARMSILTGAPLVLQDRWNAARALELVEQYGCGVTVAATPFLKDLVDTEWPSDTTKLAGLRVFLCGGAPIPPSVIEQAQHQMPDTHICSIWAMSEGGAASSLPADPPDLVAHGCGLVLPGVELETLTPQGDLAARGSEGEIVMRTPSQCLGYIGQDELFRSSFTSGGYFRTGDIGTVDDNGYLRLSGRLKDIIIRGGVNISPVELENALSDHEQIDRVAVVGIPDERLGERICAVVQPHGSAPTFEDLIAWLDNRGVPRRLWPESIRIVAAMPQTPAGKIRKNELRHLISEGTV